MSTPTTKAPKVRVYWGTNDTRYSGGLVIKTRRLVIQDPPPGLTAARWKAGAK